MSRADPGGPDQGTAVRSSWRIRDRVLLLDPPLVMGILNLTPDSFSDGGSLPDVAAAVRRAGEFVEEGAGILDLGGESTRPGAREIGEEEELQRVIPVLEALVDRFPLPLSIDTRKARVARAALAAGASIVNDVSALAFDPEMASAVAETGAGVVLMHTRGTPGEMRERARYGQVEEEVRAELAESASRARAAGISQEAIVLDPGIGFAKTGEQSLRTLGRLHRLIDLGFPVLVGPSRKSFLGELLSVPPERRAAGTASACVMAYLAGARIFRVHDVAVTSHALTVARAIQRERGEGVTQ